MNQNLKSYILGASNIAWMSLTTALLSAFVHGEVQTWYAVLEVLKDASLPAFMMVLVWLKMRSPKDEGEMAELRKQLDELRKK